MKVPEFTSLSIKEKLWAEADAVLWPKLNDQQKSEHYESWIKDPKVGDVLAQYVGHENVRVYLKDTVMKPYGRSRTKDPTAVMRAFGMSPDSIVREHFIKPHGLLLMDGRIICWGLARDWKNVLMAVFERVERQPRARAHGAALLQPAGKTNQPSEKAMIEKAARNLGIEKLVWLD